MYYKTLPRRSREKCESREGEVSPERAGQVEIIGASRAKEGGVIESFAWLDFGTTIFLYSQTVATLRSRHEKYSLCKNYWSEREKCMDVRRVIIGICLVVFATFNLKIRSVLTSLFATNSTSVNTDSKNVICTDRLQLRIIDQARVFDDN